MQYELDSCGYCGACVAVCPQEILELIENEIIIKSGCQNCGSCSQVCPLGAIKKEKHP